jgi:hypothetical protein
VNRERLKTRLVAEEAKRYVPYMDCCDRPWYRCICAVRGKLTVGVGRNIDDVPFSEDEVRLMLDNDITKVEHQLDT